MGVRERASPLWINVEMFSYVSESQVNPRKRLDTEQSLRSQGL